MTGEYWFNSHDGLRLYSRVYSPAAADAPVVLCLHGLMRNSRDFEELATRLAARARVIVPDLLPLLAGLGAARVTVIGTSMGGLMAMVLAVTQPGLVSRIVLNDVGPEIDPAGLERIRGYAGKAVAVRSWPEAVAQLRDTYGGAWPGLSDERWEKIGKKEREKEKKDQKKEEKYSSPSSPN